MERIFDELTDNMTDGEAAMFLAGLQQQLPDSSQIANSALVLLIDRGHDLGLNPFIPLVLLRELVNLQLESVKDEMEKHVRIPQPRLDEMNKTVEQALVKYVKHTAMLKSGRT